MRAGRQTGDAAWRAARGEAGSSKASHGGCPPMCRRRRSESVRQPARARAQQLPIACQLCPCLLPRTQDCGVSADACDARPAGGRAAPLLRPAPAAACDAPAWPQPAARCLPTACTSPLSQPPDDQPAACGAGEGVPGMRAAWRRAQDAAVGERLPGRLCGGCACASGENRPQETAVKVRSRPCPGSGRVGWWLRWRGAVPRVLARHAPQEHAASSISWVTPASAAAQLPAIPGACLIDVPAPAVPTQVPRSPGSLLPHCRRSTAMRAASGWTLAPLAAALPG